MISVMIENVTFASDYNDPVDSQNVDDQDERKQNPEFSWHKVLQCPKVHQALRTWTATKIREDFFKRKWNFIFTVDKMPGLCSFGVLLSNLCDHGAKLFKLYQSSTFQLVVLGTFETFGRFTSLCNSGDAVVHRLWSVVYYCDISRILFV